jgi:hypothetical protein
MRRNGLVTENKGGGAQRRTVWLLTVALCAVLVTPLRAQETAGTQVGAKTLLSRWSGMVRTASGQPAAGATVTVFEATGGHRRKLRETAVTGVDGRFSVAGVAPGRTL